jgi:hypothetical protein
MARGGSRYGAGRPSYKLKAELTLALDIRLLKRGGYLKSTFPFTWEWHLKNGYKVGSATIQVLDECLRLSYSWQGRNFENDFAFVKTPCNFGGERLWFRCPDCSGRCAKVFFNKRDGHYACRQCVGITYYSQCEDEMDRSWRKQNKLEKRLCKYWMKPKGMHQTTHTRIFNQLQACESRRVALLYSYVKRL